MREVRWLPLASYCIGTALALLVGLLFFRLVAERSGGGLWAVLIVCMAAAISISVYLAIRWYANTRVRAVPEKLMKALSDLVSEVKSNPTRQMTFADFTRLVDAGDDLFALVWKVGGYILAVFLLITTLVQLTALLNAGVGYVQIRRMEEQNMLLASQTRSQEIEFVRASMESLDSLRRQIVDSQALPQRIESNFLSNLEILPAFFSTISGLQMNGEFSVEVCEQSEASCNDWTVSNLLDEVNGGTIFVSSENIAAVRAYYRLFRVLEQVGLPFFSSYDADNLQNAMERAQSAIDDAIAVCEFSGGKRLSGLWRGISASSYGAIDSWPDESGDISLGREIPLNGDGGRANFMMVASGFGLLTEALDADDVRNLGPRDLARVLAAALQLLRQDLVSLVASCHATAADLGDTERAINSVRREMVARIITAGRGGSD